MLTLCLMLVAAGPHFEVETLNVDGEVLSVTPADLDGDGLLDLTVVHRRGKPRAKTRTFSIFWNHEGDFSTAADLSFPASDDASAYDIANIDDQKGSEILWVGVSGVSAMSFRGRAKGPVQTITKEPSLFSGADQRAFPRLGLAQAISSNEILVPLADSLAIYRRANDWFQVAKIDTSLAQMELRGDWRSVGLMDFGSFAYNVNYPSVSVADANGDGLKDIVFAIEDRVAIFHQRPGLSFERSPSFQRDFAVATTAELDKGFVAVTTSVKDIDADGVVDLLISKQVNEGITSGNATNYLYLGKAGGGYSDKPDQFLARDGVGGNFAQLADLSGDGKPELLLPAVNIGIMAIIRALTTSTLKVNVQTFLFDAGTRRFSPRFIAERDLTFKFSLSGRSDLQVIDIKGDYNGDKRPDFAFGSGDGDLGIYLGTTTGSFLAEEPSEKVKVNARGRMLSADLNKKGRDDIVLFYPWTREQRGKVAVLYNRGGW